MAKIPLRAYVKEIENLIDRGEIEQAVAHARNILRSYPKHIETYRLLGKAYLESQRYSEAADILQRVLSVYPDDFMSQIGMSIIREDENNLDAAIWHMERAYEVQPFNPAVQDELRRLYGRRDGVEPPKIRLTRGALVRMYARGDLLPQAIAETRAALAEDSQRLDLQVLLARLYDQSNQKMEAAEVSSSILSKLPFCYEANRILSEVLPGTSRAEDAQKFQQRIYALDPYAAFISPSAPSGDLVPDQAVTTERFVWDPAMTGEQSPDWARNVGVEWDETTREEEVLPDWLGTLKPDSTAQAVDQPEEEDTMVDEGVVLAAAALASQEDLVPDWMKEAGWTPTDRTADEIMAEEYAKGEGESASDKDEIAPAEIPGWLQSIAPAQSALTDEGDEQHRDEWLSTIFDEPGTGAAEKPQTASLENEGITGETEIPEWLGGLGLDAAIDQQETAAPQKDTGELAGWDQDEPAPSGDVEVPEWLRAYDGETAAPSSLMEESTSGVMSFETSEEPAETTQEVPDWLKSFESGPVETETMTTEEASPAEEIPAWLNTLQTSEDEQAAETPAWLQSMEAEEEASAAIEAVSPAAGPLQDASMEWLADEEGTPSEIFRVETLASEFETMDEEPAFVKVFDAGAVETEIPMLEAEQPQPDLDNIDDAMAWLESLAAKQGADEATLVTPPDQRLETPPDWIIQEMTTGEASGTEKLSGTEDIFQVEDLSKTEPAAAEPLEIPEWIQGKDEGQPAGSSEVEEAGAEFTFAEEADIPDWMQELAANETLPQTNAAAEPAEIPVWMQELAGAEEIAETAEPAEIPSWMQELAPDKSALTEEPESETSIPDWLSGTSEEPEGMLTPESTLSQSEPLPEQPPVNVVSSLEIEPPTAEGTPDYSDFDSAMAWLESLAAKQGADEATLVTPPEQRLETPPEWVQKATEEEPQDAFGEYQVYGEEPQVNAETVQASAEETPTFSQESGSAPTSIEESPVVAELKKEEEKLPEWIKEMITLETETPALEVEAGNGAVDAVQADEYLPAEEIAPESFTTETGVEVPLEITGTAALSTSEMDEEDAFAWLESLAARQGAQEGTLITPPEDRQETPPEWVQEEAQSAQDEAAEAMPDWLQSAAEEDASESVGTGAAAWNVDSPAWDQEGAQAWTSETTGVTGESIPAGAAAGESLESEELPAWMQQEDEETNATGETGPEAVPDWLKNLEEEERQSQPYGIELESSQEVEFNTSWSQEIEYDQQQRLAETPVGEPAGGLQEFSDQPGASDEAYPTSVSASLGQAQSALRQGQIENALVHYQRFIENGEYLKETIHDLRDALYRYPVDIDIWQSLGDAYARNNQLQDALDAYTKAEEFLR